MRCAIVILAGAADGPCAALGGRTPLSAAETPNLDLVARLGRVAGVSASVPVPGAPLFDDATALTCFLTGLSPCGPGVFPPSGVVHAAASGLDLGPDDTAFRLDLRRTLGASDVAVEGLTVPESRELFGSVVAAWRTGLLPSGAARFRWAVPGQGLSAGSGVVVAPCGAGLFGRSAAPWLSVSPGFPVSPGFFGSRSRAFRAGLWRRRVRRVSGRSHGFFDRMVDLAAPALREHEVTRVRAENRLPVADSVRVWGAGERVEFASLASRLGVGRVSLVGDDPVAVGLARLLGVRVLPLPAGLGRSAEGLGRYAAQGLERSGVVLVHASCVGRAGDAAAKSRRIESIDRFVVGPLLSALGAGRWQAGAGGVAPARFIALVDRPACSELAGELPARVPMAVADSTGALRGVLRLRVDEAGASASDLAVGSLSEALGYAVGVGGAAEGVAGGAAR